jgi:hypothetical protein
LDQATAQEPPEVAAGEATKKSPSLSSGDRPFMTLYGSVRHGCASFRVRDPTAARGGLGLCGRKSTCWR